VNDSKDWKSTLRLPSTSFPMKANLREQEPRILERWEGMGIYRRMIEAARQGGGTPFRFHDGPPYANGHIHHGHILNKVLKDIVVKFHNLTGRPTEFRPGWDCHGLPIEHAVEKEVGRAEARSNPSGFRRRCREFAARWVEVQSREFRRLGAFADWDDPYRTMTPDYEARTLREFGHFVAAGVVYQGRKPVLWCPVCETALADAEVEYRDADSPSIYVRFPFLPSVGEKVPELAGRPGGVVIWTTTPWTLPANLAIALDPEALYVAEEVPSGETWVLAEALRESFHRETGVPEGTVVATFPGRALEGAACRHPFEDRDSLLVVGDHVTMDTGTGCVHTAPGFGEDDFVVGARYGLPAFAPVDPTGRFTPEVPRFAGRGVFDSDPDVIALLRERGALVASGTIRHSYPHCWRSKNPVIFRATPQWFLRVDQPMQPPLAPREAPETIRNLALEALSDVRFLPAWGRDRITGMIRSRPDWCVSRQRHWGVPIVATRCRACDHVQTDAVLVEHVARLFDRDGADAWFDLPLEDLLPPDYRCEACGSRDLAKERDILDVWFDSGVSYAAVMEARLATPAEPHPRTDLYLEGSDQHRGWFQSSLLASVGTRGQAPYRTVLTHGFVVDGQGRKLSKSEGNYIDPNRIMDQNGAELLRLWTAAEDYRDDIRLSDEILNRLVEAYRKVRNTWRFMLGVVSDLDPVRGTLAIQDLREVDRHALLRLRQVTGAVRKAYEDYEFHAAVRLLLDYFITDLSAFYLDITKDRLYCDAEDSPRRRSAQTAIRCILRTTLSLFAPILSFTAEEAYGHLPKAPGDPESIFLVPFPRAEDLPDDPVLRERMETFLEFRPEVLRRLEESRARKEIGLALDAEVVLRIPAGSRLASCLESLGDTLHELLGVSRVQMQVEPDRAAPEIQVRPIAEARCPRCWIRVPGVHRHPEGLCGRCAAVMEPP